MTYSQLVDYKKNYSYFHFITGALVQKAFKGINCFTFSELPLAVNSCNLINALSY